jgi:hypothetical protein
MLGFKSAYDLQKSVTVSPFCCAIILWMSAVGIVSAELVAEISEESVRPRA